MAATKEIITEICPIFPRYGLNMINIFLMALGNQLSAFVFAKI
jgi:hypothetical protein